MRKLVFLLTVFIILSGCNSNTNTPNETISETTQIPITKNFNTADRQFLTTLFQSYSNALHWCEKGSELQQETIAGGSRVSICSSLRSDLAYIVELAEAGGMKLDKNNVALDTLNVTKETYAQQFENVFFTHLETIFGAALLEQGDGQEEETKIFATNIQQNAQQLLNGNQPTTTETP